MHLRTLFSKTIRLEIVPQITILRGLTMLKFLLYYDRSSFNFIHVVF